MMHQIVQLSHEFGVLENLTNTQVLKLGIFAREIADFASEVAAQRCFERSNRWHIAYWEAINARDFEKAAVCAKLRDEDTECKKLIRLAKLR